MKTMPMGKIKIPDSPTLSETKGGRVTIEISVKDFQTVCESLKISREAYDWLLGKVALTVFPEKHREAYNITVARKALGLSNCPEQTCYDYDGYK